MRHIVYILFFLILGITACQRHTVYPSAMQQAETLMNARPDSALTLLEAMADTLAILPEETRMYHQLLTIQAKDKLYITHTSDSLINRIVEFYEGHGDNDRLMMAYFYQGSTYRDMNDAPRALKAYQQAVDLKASNLDLLAKTYNQIGKLFSYQGLYDEAIQANLQSIKIYQSEGKRNKTSYALRDIARMYDVKGEKDSVLHYYIKACKTALSDNDSTKYYDILGELGGLYVQLDSLNLAKKTLIKALSHIDEHKCSHLFLYLGHIYEKESAWDSAYYHYQKTLQYGNARQRFYTLQYLFNIANVQGKTAEANDYIKKALLLKETLDKAQQTEAIAKINSLYNYQHTEQENYSFKMKQEQQKVWLLRLVALSLLLAVFCTICLFYIKKKDRERKILSQKLQQITQKRHSQSLDAIEDNIKEIKKLSNQQKEKQEKGFALESELLEIQKERLSLKNKDILNIQAEQRLRIEILKETPIYKRFYWAANDATAKIVYEDWNDLQTELNKAYPNFTQKLYDLNPDFSIQGIQICCLIKISMPSAAIARILGRSRGAITLACRRYYEKIHQSDGSAEMFRTFISQL